MFLDHTTNRIKKLEVEKDMLCNENKRITFELFKMKFRKSRKRKRNNKDNDKAENIEPKQKRKKKVKKKKKKNREKDPIKYKTWAEITVSCFENGERLTSREASLSVKQKKDSGQFKTRCKAYLTKLGEMCFKLYEDGVLNRHKDRKDESYLYFLNK